MIIESNTPIHNIELKNLNRIIHLKYSYVINNIRTPSLASKRAL